MKTLLAIVESVVRQDSRMQVLDLEGRDVPAVCYKDLAGSCAPGDRVVVNVTATSMELGTGGYDFVICKVDSQMDRLPSSSKILKLRYTPLQCEVDCIEAEDSPYHEVLRDATSLEGMPVVCCGLHSQLVPVAAGIRDAMPDARIVYCMTDEASLMLPFSDTARRCVETGLVNLSITCGQAMGGDAEAVSLHSALVAAHTAFDADVAIVSIGPGIAGTGTALGNGGTAQAEAVNAAAALGGQATAVMRVSFADARSRHMGVSHHFLTAMGTLALASADVCYPARLEQDDGKFPLVSAQLDESGISRKHRLVAIEVDDATLAGDIGTRGVPMSSMGRGFADDPWFFLTAYVAGTHAADQAMRMREGEAR